MGVRMKQEVATQGNDKKQEVALTPQEEQYMPIQQGGGIDYGNVVQADTDDMDAVIDAFSRAKAAPLNANKETWNPSAPGESRLLMFLTYDLIDAEFQGKLTTGIPYVVFAEPRKGSDGKPFIAQVMTGRSQIANFFLKIDRESKRVLGAKQPQKSLWQITYEGIRSVKDRNIHSYSIQPATVV